MITLETEGLILSSPISALDGGERMRVFDRVWLESEREGGGAPECAEDETTRLVHEIQIDDVVARRYYSRRPDGFGSQRGRGQTDDVPVARRYYSRTPSGQTDDQAPANSDWTGGRPTDYVRPTERGSHRNS